MNMKQFWKWPLCVILLFGLLAVPAFASETMSNAEEPDYFEFQYDPLRQAQPDDPDAVILLERTTDFEQDHTCYGDQLDEEEKAAYDALCEAVSRGEYTAKAFLSGGTSNDKRERLLGIVSAYITDHPLETAALTGRVSSSISNSGCTIKLYTFVDDSESDATELSPEYMMTNLKNAVEEFYSLYVQNVAENASDLDKYRYVHDYITGMCSYNNVAYETPNLLTYSENKNAHSSYGALVGLGEKNGSHYDRGNVVCEGYAKAYMVLCQRVGLPCITISGGAGSVVGNTSYIPSSNNHMWNGIKLDGEWYALDATWDDYEIEMTPEWYDELSNQVDIATTVYKYFADNRYFHPANRNVLQDHQAYSQFNYAGYSWMMNAPELSNVRYAPEDLLPEKVEIVLHAPEDGGKGDFRDAMWALSGYLFFDAGITLDEINDITITLMGDVEFSGDQWYKQPVEIRDGQTYAIVRGVGAAGSTITRAAGYSDSFFVVEPGGSLMLGGVTLDGSGMAAKAPLIDASVSGGVDGKFGLVYMLDSHVVDNQGACGIDSDGVVILKGSCWIEGNTNAYGNDENLKLRTYGVLYVEGAMTNAQVGVTTLEGYPFAWSYGYEWTETDRAVFRCDDPDLHFAYDAAKDRMYCTVFCTTDNSQPVSFAWVQRPTLETVGKEEVFLQNNTNADQSLRVWTVMYDKDGRMTAVVFLAEMDLESDQSGILLMPEAKEGTVCYQLMILDASGTILSEALTISE